MRNDSSKSDSGAYTLNDTIAAVAEQWVDAFGGDLESTLEAVESLLVPSGTGWDIPRPVAACSLLVDGERGRGNPVSAGAGVVVFYAPSLIPDYIDTYFDGREYAESLGYQWESEGLQVDVCNEIVSVLNGKVPRGRVDDDEQPGDLETLVNGLIALAMAATAKGPLGKSLDEVRSQGQVPLYSLTRNRWYGGSRLIAQVLPLGNAVSAKERRAARQAG